MNFILIGLDALRGDRLGCDGYWRKDISPRIDRIAEEGVLFKVMIDAGMPMEGGPIAVMLSEHEQARAYTRSLREAAERWEQGDDLARKQVAQAATSYAMLLRQHIAKEDRILFPMADQAIPASKHGQVMTDFANVESDKERAAVYTKYIGLADSLEQEIRRDTEEN